MKKNLKHIIVLILFFLVQYLIKITFPTLGASTVINLIAMFAINALLLLTIVYLYFEDINNDLKFIKENKKKSFFNFLTYTYMLLLFLIIVNVIIYITTNSSADTLFKIEHLYKKLPTYIFLDTIIIFPLINSVIYRVIPFNLIKNSLLFLIVSTLFFAFYAGGFVIELSLIT